jgi:hypothetical protein
MQRPGFQFLAALMEIYFLITEHNRFTPLPEADFFHAQCRCIKPTACLNIFYG